MPYRGPTEDRPPTRTQVGVLHLMEVGWRLCSTDGIDGRESFYLVDPKGGTHWVNGKTHRGLHLRRLVDIDLSGDAVTKWMLTARGREALKKG